MLAAYTKTFLRIGYSSMLRRDITEYDVLELVHAGIGEHQCRVVLITIGAEGTIWCPLLRKKSL